MSEKRHCWDLQVTGLQCEHVMNLRPTHNTAQHAAVVEIKTISCIIVHVMHPALRPAALYDLTTINTGVLQQTLSMDSKSYPFSTQACSCVSLRMHRSEMLKKHLPILLIRFWCSTGAALAVFTGHIAALPVWSVFVFQDVLDAEVPAFYARLGARSLRERACLGLQGARRLRHSAPAGRQHVDPNPVHPGYCVGKSSMLMKPTHTLSYTSALIKHKIYSDITCFTIFFFFVIPQF